MSSADEKARALRDRIAAAPDDELDAERGELVASLGINGRYARPEDLPPDRVAQAVLVHHGIATRPSLTHAADGQRIELRLTNRYAVQGAAAVTAAAAVAGFLGRPLYGVLLGLAAGAGLLLLARRWPWVDARVPDRVPRGRLLGALVAVVPALVIGVVAILPLRAHYRSSHQADVGATLTAQADAALAAGDLAGARQKLTQAETAHPPPSIEDVRARVLVAEIRAALSDGQRKDRVYAEAERAFRAHRIRAAVALMTSISGYRDADARAQAFRRGKPR